MTRTGVTAVVLGLVLGVPSSPASTQVPGALAVEAWGGAAVGAFEATGAGLKLVPRGAWGAAVDWGPGNAVGGYLAYSSAAFGCRSAFCQGHDVRLEARGLSLGARASLDRPGAPWGRAGVLLHRFHQTWDDAGGREDRDAAMGVEVAAGGGFALGDRVSVVPAVHVGFLPTRAPDGVREDVLFTAARIGVRYRF